MPTYGALHLCKKPSFIFQVSKGEPPPLQRYPQGACREQEASYPLPKQGISRGRVH